jgi:hypothetical protein
MNAQEENKRDHTKDKMQTFETGATRSILNERFDLICPAALRRLALRYALGVVKHGENQWCKGIPISVCLNHLENHLANYKMNGNRSEDNMAAIAWNAFAIMHYEEGCKHHLAPFVEEERRVCDCKDSCVKQNKITLDKDLPIFTMDFVADRDIEKDETLYIHAKATESSTIFNPCYCSHCFNPIQLNEPRYVHKTDSTYLCIPCSKNLDCHNHKYIEKTGD